MRTSMLVITALMLLPTTTGAVAADPLRPDGAHAGDKEMSCEAIATERDDLAVAIDRRATTEAKRKGTLFGFGKRLFTHVLPVEAARIGGGAGRVAMTAAGHASVAADSAPAPTAKPKPTQAEADRMARLDSIAAYRQCPA